MNERSDVRRQENSGVEKLKEIKADAQKHLRESEDAGYVCYPHEEFDWLAVAAEQLVDALLAAREAAGYAKVCLLRDVTADGKITLARIEAAIDTIDNIGSTLEGERHE